jgi:asparagine synthase (glutamine-hydrolysing)
MCGICGKVFIDKDHPVDPLLIKSMMDVIRHRGPDDEGMHIARQVGLGHRRLSIIDLNTGKQPIYNEDGTVCIVFNGEIYNYQEIRNQLLAKGHFFKTKTDTEVIIHAYEEYGEECVSKLRGMFAFAIWDEREQILLLARDRVGIKPLYYSFTSDSLIFASEMKAILQGPEFKREINYPIIDRFLTYLYVPGAETLIKNIYKLKPGHVLILKNGKVDVKQYWDLNFSSFNNGSSLKESKAQLVDLLRESVKIHMISDVPVGFLLSGGVDSSALLSLAIQETGKDISTFTVGFSGEKFADERKYARLAANAFGTKQYDLSVTAKEFGDFLPKYVWHMEEPVCEPPAVGLYYVTKLASEHVKVLISGEGGDEAFAGYQTYRNLIWLERLKKTMGPLSGTLGGLLKGFGTLTGLGRLEKYVPLLSMPLVQYYYSRTSNPFTFFNSEYRNFYTADFMEAIDKEASTEPTRQFVHGVKSPEYLATMLYTDTKTWLPDDLLVKADKMTMANSVELRVPLLDHKVLEFAASLPSYFKLRGFTTKYILKGTFEKIVPQEILQRKKTGFPMPYQTWMRKDLKDLVHDTLLSQKALDRNYFNREGIEKILSANLCESKYAKEVFSLLILELWHRAFIDREADIQAPG